MVILYAQLCFVSRARYDISDALDYFDPVAVKLETFLIFRSFFAWNVLCMDSNWQLEMKEILTNSA
jgi:hypothetical protein